MIDKLAKDIMVPPQEYPCIRAALTLRGAIIDQDDNTMKVVSEMLDRNVSLPPVLKDGSVVGMVRSVDVLSDIALILSS